MNHPFFSVVLPTYGRGRHIKPSIESVLAQSFGDLELIVVGDGCNDDTEEAVRSYSSERIKWLNLASNSGSQSAPNNEGIRASRGHWVAYIGHDDIWAPDHLERISHTIASRDGLDFVIAGCIFHGPKGSENDYVVGLFDDDYEAPFWHFFPPSSIAHRCDVTPRIGDWRDPRKLKRPLDNEFLLRAARAGLRFTSTGQVTVHKFAAGHRYLSYLRASSDEQREFLQAITSSPSGVDIDRIVRATKAAGRYMSMQYSDVSNQPEGFLFEQNKKRKGIMRPPLTPLLDQQVIRQAGDPRDSDWHDLESQGERLFRWSGPSPRPKILIPYSGGHASISIEVRHRNPNVPLEKLALYIEDRPLEFWIKNGFEGVSYLCANIVLQNSDYTVLTFDAPTFRPADLSTGKDPRKLGIAVGDITVVPISPR